MDKQSTVTLPARPHLDHLKGQAKTLLAQLRAGGGTFKLADAQTMIARQHGFASWPVLVRHIEQLRGLEGEWRIARLEIDGAVTPAPMVADARILIDGDRFRTESAEGTYEGIFHIDAEASPPHFDIEFIAGPEAGNWSRGIYRLDGDDELVLCLGLTGAERPRAFETRAGRGHALEHLHRTSAARPVDVTGGTPPPPPEALPRADGDFDTRSPEIERLQGEWVAVALTMDGKPMPDAWLVSGRRTMTGNEVEVAFGGQTMVHARVRIDDTVTPIAVDYLDLRPKTKGALILGIMAWDGDEVRFLMAPSGKPRPADFAARGTLSRWRRR